MRNNIEDHLSPLNIILLAVNGFCFGGSLVLLALGKASGPLVLMTVGCGLSFLSFLILAVYTARARMKERKLSNKSVELS